jgi:hypothetical protein
VWTRLPGPVVTLEVDALARLWGRLVVVLLPSLLLLRSDIGVGKHLEGMVVVDLKRFYERGRQLGAQLGAPLMAALLDELRKERPQRADAPTLESS